MAGRKWPVADIPESAIVPDGEYLVQIQSVDGDTPSSTGKLMYAAAFGIGEPKAFKGLPLNDNFVIGSDDDPEAEDPETWKVSVGARRMKRMFKAAGVSESDDLDEMIEASVGQQIILIVTQETETREGPYKGRIRNRIQAYYAQGERQPSATATAAAKPAARPAAPVRPTAAKPAPAPATPLKPAPKAAAKGQMWPCSICGEAVPRAEFAAHVNAHEE